MRVAIKKFLVDNAGELSLVEYGHNKVGFVT